MRKKQTEKITKKEIDKIIKEIISQNRDTLKYLAEH